MKLFAFIFGLRQRREKKTLAEYQRETLVRAGRQQFKKLVDLGLNVPITLL